ncbi:Leucine-rich repeat-containing protein 23 [Boothiomyces macroporosus]|uniref:Leucine-rich repeat-containing protein 23 n=1 Tax=Boothiomyces macroporosus TaxID=261099 RepID=A0AAD5Y6X4_9FUNG|nr:Leucine-rich repeat-containing protein 23 [Boothiomyces macroporosus]
MQTVTLMGQQLENWSEIFPQIHTASYQYIKSLNLHSNLLKVLDPSLCLLPNLTILDMSSNQIESFVGINLPSLKSINLSNNKIKQIGGLENFKKLEFLKLSFNSIENLECFKALHGSQYPLKYLDLRGNDISDVKQIAMLNGCLQLRELLLATQPGYKTNPVCKTAVNIFSILPQLTILDERNSSGDLETTLYEDPTVTMFDSLLESDIGTPPRRKDLVTDTPFENMIPFEHEEFDTIRQYARTPVEHKHQKLPTNRLSPRPIIIENNNGEILAKMLQLQEQIQNITQKSANNESEKISLLERQIQQLAVTISKEREKTVKIATPKIERVIQTETVEDQKTVERFQQLEKQINSLFDFVKEGEKRQEEKEKTMKKRILKELPVNVEISPATSEEFIQIPTKLPKRKTKNQSLVWLEDDSEEIIDLSRQTPPKKFVKVSQNQLNPNPKVSNSVANLKLIAVLEAEQRRLKENEQRYAEKIKELNSELNSLKSSTTEFNTIKTEYTDLKAKYEAVKSSLSEYRKISLEKQKELEDSIAQSKNLTLQNEDYQCHVDKLDAKIKELSNNCSLFQKQIAELQNEFSKTEKSNKILEAEKEKLYTHCKTVENENSKLSVRLIKERESFKVKCAELKSEKQQILENVEKGNREIAYLKSLLSQKEESFRNNVESLITSHKNEMEAAVAKATKIETEKQSYLTDSLKKQLSQTQEAYKALELEFLSNIKKERKARAAAEEKLKESLQEKEESLKNVVNLEKKTKEQTDTIAELVKMVKELKANFDFLQEKERNSTQLYHASIQRFDENASKLQLLNNEKVNIEQKLQSAEQSNKSLLENNTKLQSELDSLLKKLSSMESSKEHQLNEKEKQIEILNKELRDMQSKYANYDDVLKIKESMLQDQNDTIKTLKTNLENKTREYQNVKKELELSSEYLQEYEQKEKSEYQELEDQVREYRENQESYRAMAQDYKLERDELRQEVISLTEKLNQRNASIEMIEKEVEKVKKNFDQKQQALIDKQQSEVQELEQKYSAEMAELSYYKSEKESILHQLRQTQSLLHKCTLQKDNIEKELRFVLMEMDKQKKASDAKMAKLLATVKEMV